MSTAGFALRGRNPDVLTCIANLSNDEVFTPPEFANRMLDTLAEAWAANNNGANLWADKTVKFLDPCTKSGVFLREIASRLTKGLADEMQSLEKRVDHILTKQVFGIAITHLTSLLARRSVYCSKHARGKGLDKYRERMLSDKRMRSIVDYPKLYEGFPGVKIRGGISYFLWDRDHNGPCTVQTVWAGQPTGPAVARHLDAYDILVRRNEAVPILEKVRAKGEPTLDARVSSQKPFGLRTFFHGKPDSQRLKNPVKLFGSQKISWVESSEIPTNASWIDKWKVLTTRVQGTSAAVETKFLSKPIIAEPGTACTESYVVAGLFDTEVEATNYAEYLRTRFARFLVSLRKSTQDAPKNVYAFIPDLPLNQEWTDTKLYQRYGLTREEIAFIESQVAEHASELFDEAAADEVEDG